MKEKQLHGLRPKQSLALPTFLFFLVHSASVLGATEYTELHWSICEPTPSALMHKLGVRTPNIDFEEKRHTLYYWDTTSLDLWNQKTVIRQRDRKKKSEIIIKILDVTKSDLPPDLRYEKGLSCEQDYFGENTKKSCSLSQKIKTPERLELDTIISQKQKRLLLKFDQANTHKKVRPLGPLQFRRWLITLKGAASRFSKYAPNFNVEEIKDEKKFLVLELSTRVASTQESELYKKITDALRDKKISLCKTQVGKTPEILVHMTSQRARF